MKKKNAFAVTIEMVLVILACCIVTAFCLAAFSDNLSNLFGNDSDTSTPKRNYKTIFDRTLD